MLDEGGLLRERIRAPVTLVRFVSCVGSHVHNQLTVVTEALPTDFTNMRLGWFYAAVSLAPFVFAQTPLQCEHFLAQVTFVRLHIGMNVVMLFQSERIFKQFVAHIALVCAVGNVCMSVLGKLADIPKCLVALVAFVRLNAGVRSFVHLQVMRLAESFVAAVTSVRSFLAMSTAMCSQLAYPSECLVAYTTHMCLFCRMNTFMLG